MRDPRRRKAYVLALGAVGLASALTAAAFVAPDRAAAAARPYAPAKPSDVVATVPRRDPREVAERRALAQAPDRVELAVALARADIGRARALSDPRPALVPVPVPGCSARPRAILDILDRRKAVATTAIGPARELIVRVAAMFARLASA